MTTKRRLKARVVACKDCGEPLVYSGFGRPPARCAECFQERFRQKARDRYDRLKRG